MSIDITNNITLDAAGGSLEPAKNADLDKPSQAGAADSIAGPLSWKIPTQRPLTRPDRLSNLID